MEVKNLMTFTDRTGLSEWFERNHPSEKCCWVACSEPATPGDVWLRRFEKNDGISENICEIC